MAYIGYQILYINYILFVWCIVNAIMLINQSFEVSISPRNDLLRLWQSQWVGRYQIFQPHSQQSACCTTTRNWSGAEWLCNSVTYKTVRPSDEERAVCGRCQVRCVSLKLCVGYIPTNRNTHKLHCLPLGREEGKGVLRWASRQFWVFTTLASLRNITGFMYLSW